MASFFTMNFLTELLLSTVRMATPILLVALAETYSERAGMVNIGLDGIMAIGALVGFLVGYETGSPFARNRPFMVWRSIFLLRRWHLLFTGFPFLIRLH